MNDEEFAHNIVEKSLAFARGQINTLEAELADREQTLSSLLAALDEARELLEWTEDDDWWSEPGFAERRDAWLTTYQRGEGK